MRHLCDYGRVIKGREKNKGQVPKVSTHSAGTMVRALLAPPPSGGGGCQLKKCFRLNTCSSVVNIKTNIK